MSARYPLDPFALPNGPDIPLSSPSLRGDVRGTVFRLLIGVGLFSAAVSVLALVLFVPVLFSEAARIDAVILDGRLFQKADLMSLLGDLFMGTAIFSLAVISFIASAALSLGGRTRWREPGRPAGAKPTAGGSMLKIGISYDV
jgi:hypothetical protein